MVLIEAGPAILASYSDKLRECALRDLRAMNVEVLLSHRAVHIDENGIEVSGPGGTRNIPTKTVIWAAGVKASPLAKLLAAATGAPLDHAGRLGVEPDCSLVGHPEVFAIGDMIAISGVPGTAQPAIQEGKYVGRLIRARVLGRESPPPFRYHDLGSMAVIGRMRAVATIEGFSFGGVLAFLIWAFVHLVYLIGWERRLETVLRWTASLLTRERAERLISVTSLVSEEQARADLTRRLDATLGRRPALL
ncbi:MAG: FAD-dependent oxidoreductase [Rhizomicrobium sp.]